MVNYYKILGIQNYADIDQVKSAYKDKIRKYHPDLNPSADAAEISKYLNIAKDILTDPVRKTGYDKQLKLAYLIEIARLKGKKKLNSWRSLSVTERKRRMEENQKIKEKQRYQKSLRTFPLSYRLVGLVVFILFGLQLVYSNYFIMFNGNEHLYILAGLAVFVASLIMLTNETYQYYWIKSVDVAIRFNYEKWIGRLLILILFLGPLSIFGLNEYRKSYHLEHNAEYYLAEIDVKNSSYKRLVYTYTINGETFSKQVEYSRKELIVIQPNKVLIKYATVDPRISVLVMENETRKIPREL